MIRAMTSLSMWKLSATRAMELVQLPTMSSTNMKLPVMPSIPRILGPVPQEVQHNTLGNFILSLCSVLLCSEMRTLWHQLACYRQHCLALPPPSLLLLLLLPSNYLC